MVDSEKLQGCWKPTRCYDGLHWYDDQMVERMAILSFAGEEYVAQANDYIYSSGVFRIDAKAAPKEIDLIQTWMPELPDRGIYELDGDRLTIYFAGFEQERSKTFSGPFTSFTRI